MPTLNSRVLNLEQRTQPRRPHRMTQHGLVLHLDSMAVREVGAFAKTMTDDDLTAGIEYLKTITEQHHANA